MAPRTIAVTDGLTNTENTETPLVWCLLGPTCAGKTALAIELALHFPLDIISVDSALVYRGLDIGTAKPSAAELALAPHQLIDIREPSDIYSAADFTRDANTAIAKSIENQRIPFLVGGTMFYFHALFQGLSPLPAADPLVRARIVSDAERQGWLALHQQLQIIDPVAAARIHPNDPQRLQRALEVYYQSGRSMSDWLGADPRPTSPYRMLKLGLIPEDRSQLHARIALRFETMLAAGFLEEATRLFARPDIHADLPAMRTVGYRQAWEYFQAQRDETWLREEVVCKTRQLAKRQLTWLRRFDLDHQFDCFSPLLFQEVRSCLQEYIIAL